VRRRQGTGRKDHSGRRAARIAGRVVSDEDGQPLEHVAANCHDAAGLAGSCFTDTQGRSEISSMNPGRARVEAWTVQAPGRPTLFRTAELTRGENTLELRLKKAGFIKGRVVADATGEPVAYFGTLFAHAEKTDSACQIYVDKDGTFSVPVYPGRNSLAMWNNELYTLLDAKRWNNVGVEVAEGQTVDVELRVGPTLMARLIGWLQSN
jgi:hypothetical protein